MGIQTLEVRHNMEVAHRLFQSPGKCENIHGHSMWVTMTLYGYVDNTGKVAGLDFGDVKKKFRGELDTKYDHHLLLNENDPWAQSLGNGCNCYPEETHTLPGLVRCEGDPTTENLAYWIWQWASLTFDVRGHEVHVAETDVNAARCTGPR